MEKRTGLLALVACAEAAVLVVLLVGGRGRNFAAAPAAADGLAPIAPPSHAPPPRDGAGEPAPPAAVPATAPSGIGPPPTESPGAVPAAEPPPIDSVTLFGTVRDQDGAPVERVGVSLTGPAGARHRAQSVPFAIGGLAPGTWTLQCRARGFKPYDAAIDIDGRSRVHRHDITLQASVVVRVRFLTPDGEPLNAKLGARLAEAGVYAFGHGPVIAVATAEAPAGDLPPTPHRSLSRFDLGGWTSARDAQVVGAAPVPDGWDGTLELSRPPPLFVSAVIRNVVLVTKPVAAGTAEVTLEVPLADALASFGTVRLRLVDATSGAPITKAQVSLNDRQSMGGETPIGEDGSIEWRLRPPGFLGLRIWSMEHEMVDHSIRVRPGETTDLGTLALERAVQIAGTVRDESGQPVKCAVSAHRLDRLPFRQPLETGMTFGLEEPGRFGVGWAGRGAVLVRCVAQGYAPHAVLVDTSGGSVENVAVTLVRGVEVTLVSRVPPTAQELWWIVDPAGLPVWTHWVTGPHERKLRLAPGAWRLLVHDAEGVERATHALRVGASPVVFDVPR